MTVLKACGTNIYKGRGEHFYNTRYNFFRFNSTQQCNIKTNISPDQKGHNYLTNITSNFKNGVELHNTLFPVAEKLNLVEVELSSTEESEAAAYGVVVEAAEVQVALTECYQSHKDCSLPAALETAAEAVLLG